MRTVAEQLQDAKRGAFYTTEQIDHCARQILHAEHEIPVTHEQVLTMWHAMPEAARDAYRQTALARLGDYASMTHEERAAENRSELAHVLRSEQPHAAEPSPEALRAREARESLHAVSPGATPDSSIVVVDAATFATFATDVLAELEARRGEHGATSLQLAMGAMDPAARAFFERQIEAQMPGEVEAAWTRPGARLKALQALLASGRELRSRGFWLQCMEAITLDERDVLRASAAKRALKLAAAESKRERKRRRNKRALRSGR